MQCPFVSLTVWLQWQSRWTRKSNLNKRQISIQLPKMFENVFGCNFFTFQSGNWIYFKCFSFKKRRFFRVLTILCVIFPRNLTNINWITALLRRKLWRCCWQCSTLRYMLVRARPRSGCIPTTIRLCSCLVCETTINDLCAGHYCYRTLTSRFVTLKGLIMSWRMRCPG